MWGDSSGHPMVLIRAGLIPELKAGMQRESRLRAQLQPSTPSEKRDRTAAKTQSGSEEKIAVQP